MRKLFWLGLILVVISLFVITSCATDRGFGISAPWYDNEVNAVYFSEQNTTIERVIKNIGDWQKQNPNKELILNLSPFPNLNGNPSAMGYVFFYRYK